jgi:type IV pilus assembly protein PilM
VIRHRRNVNAIGIDFGSYAIRMMQVGGGNRGAAVSASAEYVYPASSGDAEASAAERRRAAVAAVRQMLSSRHAGDSRFVGRRVVTALSDRDLQVRNLRLPPMPEEELAAAVRYEAAERFGFEVSQTECRYFNVGTVRSGDQVQREIALLVVPGDAVRRHLELVSELGLTAEAVDIAPCAAFRPFERFLRREADADEVNAFVDLGYSGTRITVVRGREIVFLKTFDIGAARFDGLVSEHLSIDPQEARDLRRRLAAAEQELAEPQDEPVPTATRKEAWQAIRPAADQLGKELALCLRYCAVTFRGPRCQSVTCVGGGALGAGLLEQLGEAMGVPARKGHPLRNVACDGVFSMADQCTGQPEWATAFGLALKPRDANYPASTSAGVEGQTSSSAEDVAESVVG